MRKIHSKSLSSKKQILDMFKHHFPKGEVDDFGFKINDQGDEFTFTVLQYFNKTHVTLFEGQVGEDTETLLSPNPNKSIIIRCVLESSLDYKDQHLSIGQGNANGISLFNTYNDEHFIVQAKTWVKYMTIHIPIEFWMNYTEGRWKNLNAIITNEKPWILFEMMTPQFSNLIRDIFAYNKLELGRYPLILSRSIELFTRFLMKLDKRNSDKKSIGVSDVELGRLMKVKAHLMKNLHHPPNMEILSEQFGMSPTKLRSNFKKVFGFPPYQYVIRERLQEAYRLLISTERSYIDIALSLGFNDQSHFNKAFKSTFDCSPGSLRE